MISKPLSVGDTICFSSVAALFSLALSCGDLELCHRFLNCLLSRIFCLIVGAQVSRLGGLQRFGVEFQAACCIICTS
jgi:hypothetical protein